MCVVTGRLSRSNEVKAVGPAIGPLFLALFLVHFFNNALITLTAGPICSDTVPATPMATASGVVIAVDEIFGGGIAPIVAGQVAERLGIDQLLSLPILAMAAGFLLCLRLKETKPAPAVTVHRDEWIPIP